MDRRVPFPVFGNPPEEYEPSFFNDLMRKLNFMALLIRTPGEGRQTTIVLTNLSSTDYGLEPGTLFQVNGAVRIALPYSPYVGGVSASGSSGSVTVTTV